jgi:hypothetical protein
MITITYYFLLSLTVVGANISADVVNKFPTKKQCEQAIEKAHLSVDTHICTKVNIKIQKDIE